MKQKFYRFLSLLLAVLLFTTGVSTLTISGSLVAYSASYPNLTAVMANDELVAGEDNEITINLGDPTFNGKETVSISGYTLYIPDGLKLHLDGIQNTPEGHSSSTTTWYDLSGNNNSVTVQIDSQNFWQDDAWRLDCSPVMLNEDITNVIRSGEFTVEFLLSDFATTGVQHRYAVVIGLPSDEFSIYYNAGWSPTYTMRLKTVNTAGAKIFPLDVSFDVDDKTNTITYSVNNSSSWYVNGDLAQGTNTYTPTYAPIPADVLRLGGPTPQNTYDITTDYKSFRIYDRPLTKQEVEHNNSVDRSRFYGEDTDVLGTFAGVNLKGAGTTDVELTFVDGKAHANLNLGLDPTSPIIITVGDTSVELSGVDTSELEALIALAKTKNKDDWASDSWEYFEDKLNAAEDVIEQGGNQAEVDLAKDELAFAIDNLVPKGQVDKTKLRIALENAGKLNQQDYTGNSWNNMIAAKNSAQAVYDNSSATQQDVYDKANALNAAVDNLVSLVAIKAAIEATDALIEADYTKGSWQNMITQKNNAIAVRDNPASTQLNINNAIASLNAAVSALVSVVELKAEIADAEELNEDDYTIGSWNAFQSVLTEAEDLLEQDNPTKNEIDTVIADLTAAEDNLVSIVELNEAIALAEDLVETDWTQESWAAMQTVWDEAVEVKETENPTRTQIINAANNLLEKIDALTTDKTYLIIEIAKSNLEKEEDYTPESWAPFEEARDHAISVNNNPDSKQSEIDDAYTDLKAKMEALVPVTPAVDKTELQEAIERLEGFIDEKPWAPAALQELLDEAEAIMDDENATQEEVDALTQTINDTIGEFENRVLGDVNGDENVMAMDALWTLQSISGKRELDAIEQFAADVNKDGEVTALDALWILQFVSDKRDSF